MTDLIRFPTVRQAGVLAAAAALALGGCSRLGLSTSVGPTRGAITRATGADAKPSTGIAGMRIVELTDDVARTMSLTPPLAGFADTIGDAQPIGTTVGIGDTLEVTIYEAPPAVLFGAATFDTRVGSPIQGSRPSILPEVQVGPSGRIAIPFAGNVRAASRTLAQIERDIVGRLRGKANQPQAIVRISRNATQNVTVVGEVANAARLPLSPRGERLLDALAQAGGTSQPLDRMTVQITRGGVTSTMALQDVIRDARHNIVLRPDDVVAALYQPYSFTVLGAAGRNDEVRFEGMGITLSQALGRVGGLQDQRADPKGVFLFRWEDPDLLRDLAADVDASAAGVDVVSAPRADGRVPVIYRIDLNSPATYFAVQNFRMRDRDVVYVSNSPLTDFQRFVNILASSVLPVVTVNNAVRTN